MKPLAILVLLVILAVPAVADEAVSTSTLSAKDLRALNKAVADQKITKAQSAQPVVNISGYAETSYTKVLTGSNSLAGTCPKSGSLTTEKVSVNITTSDKSNTWFGGIQIDAIHCSSK